MYPMTCHDGSEHNFSYTEKDEKAFKCSVCGISYGNYCREKIRREELSTKVMEVVSSANSFHEEDVAQTMFLALSKSHRTIQQSFFRAFSILVNKMKDMPVDARNEAAVEWCKKVSEIETNFPRI
jgi:hypothetical protein